MDTVKAARRRRRGLRLLAALLLMVSLYDAAWSAWNAAADGFVDLPIFLQRAREFLDTGVLYTHINVPGAYGPSAATYKFPPLFAMLLLPQVALDAGDRIYVVHWIVQLLLYAAAVTLLFLTLRDGRQRLFGLLLLLAALNYEPFFDTLWRLQLETPILLLLALALWCAMREKDVAAGAAVGAAAMLKVYPAFLLLYFVVRRRWRALAGAAGAALLLGAAGWIVIGPAQNRVWLFEVLPTLLAEQPLVTPENVSPAKTVHVALGLSPGLAKRAGQLLALAAVVLTVLAGGRARGAAVKAATPLELGALVALMLAFMPNLWTNYLLLLLLPFAAALARLDADGRWPPTLTALLALAWTLTLFHTPCAPADVPWPCAQTPRVLGLFQLPRGLHDVLVKWKVLVAPLVWTVCYALLLRAVREQPAAELSAGHAAQAKAG